ncbi:single-stranded DNA-binding protein [Candidatus Nitrosotenuis cloacae]|uniref:Single-stranded DNA-binding protein n=1 Tax=Candidatus Nitrosotenuis cloacae TaxID=1603555 RepID=A0A3G1B7C9_9ARCH|nr:single-stranded DNA-binding protein [Candidatus Nitrosotenuis cloacae]AJZ76111.1 single-stranded DNA-binding protein [Candidatus Nitrosotenuis cloacae]
MSEFDALLSKLLELKPDLSKTDVEGLIAQKKEKIGAGYLTDQGALFLVASDLGITISEPPKGEINIRDLHAGAKEVTLQTRVLNVSPKKQFSRKDGSQFYLRNMTVYDKDSAVTVKLWDEKANLPEMANISPGDLIKIIKAYVKSDLNGQLTINIGSGSNIERTETESTIPSIDSITKDISELKEGDNNVVVSGMLDGPITFSEFTNFKGVPGTALRLRLKGKNEHSMRVVLWGKSNSDIPKVIPAGTRARLIGVKAKTNQQELEIHGNESTTLEVQAEKQVEPIVIRILSATKNENGQRMILGVDKQKQLYNVIDTANVTESFAQDDVLECMPSKLYGNSITVDAESFVRKIQEDIPGISELRTKIVDVKPDNNTYCIEAIILKAPERRNVQTKTGETITLSEMYVEDDTAQIWLKGWRNQARLLDECSIGEIISVTGVTAKPGLEGRTELFVTPYSGIKKKN